MGRQRTRQLMAHFGPEVNPFDLSVKELCSVKGISKDIAGLSNPIPGLNSVRQKSKPPAEKTSP